MKRLKVLTVGFDLNELAPSEHLIYALHTPGVTEGMTAREYHMKCKQMVKDSDVVIVKSSERKLEEDEVVLLYSAYSISTPIFGVGNTISSPLLEAVMVNRFNDNAELLDHLTAYYISNTIGG